MAKRYSTSFLREKSDEQCRSLASTYYKRARASEDAHKATQEELERVKEQLEKLRVAVSNIEDILEEA